MVSIPASKCIMRTKSHRLDRDFIIIKLLENEMMIKLKPVKGILPFHEA